VCRFVEIKYDKKKLEEAEKLGDDMRKDNIAMEKVSHHQA